MHGFGSSGCVYYRVIRNLKRYFRVTTFDFLGQGCSGRPKINLENGQQYVDFILYSTEAWMKATSYDSKPYYLFGHSLGAYFAALYAIKSPKNIQKVILMSPIGIPSRPDDWDEKELEDDQNWEDIIS